VSFIGYVTQEIAVGNQSAFNIRLIEDTQALEEIVVVGYGTQKKVNLTGAVSTVNFEKEALSRPLTTATAGLAGMSAGLAVLQGSGRPNAEGVSVKIRGIGTLNNSDPLILVDGVEQSLSNVNPNDIASISILKDAASCAIYGNRGANGVILVTTKTAKQGKINVTYSGFFSYDQPANLVKFVSNYADYMTYMNESAESVGAGPIYSQSTIEKWRSAEKNPNGLAESGYPNYVAYPNTDWYDVIFKDKIMQQHTISVLGSEGRTSYNFSATYLNNPGLIDESGMKRYYLRSNVSSQVTDWLKLGTRIWGYHTDQDRNDVSVLSEWAFLKMVPGIYPYYDGKYGAPETSEEDAEATNGLLKLNDNGGWYKYSQLNSQAFAEIKFLNDFTFNTTFNYDFYRTEHQYVSGGTETWSFSKNQIYRTATPLDVRSVYMWYQGSQRWKWTNLLNYVKSYDIHDITAMIGYEEESYKVLETDNQKRGMLDPTITDLAAVTTPIYITGSSSAWTSRSIFGRATYAFDSRYLFEVNIRRDGSSRFAPKSRWGYFPSVSAAWRISEEDFMENVNIDNLKLRASYGKLGNNGIGNYEWQAMYNTVNYSFANVKTAGLASTTLANTLLEWESTTSTDIGLDFGFLKNRLSGEIDFYDKTTDGILYRPDIYLTLGEKTGPRENIAQVNNRGLEFTLTWQDRIGSVDYRVSGNFSYNRNRVTKYKGLLERGWTTDANGNRVYQTNLGEVSTGGLNRVLEGKMINEFYTLNLYSGDQSYFNSDGSVNINGGPKDGMIRTEKDMEWLKAMFAAGYNFYPNQNIGKNTIWYGDNIYADLNGDGIYGNSYDYDFQNASTNPKYNYGLQAGASWNNFDFSMNWSGAAGFKIYWYEVGQNKSATVFGLSIGEKVAKDHYFYDPENPNDPRTNLTSKTTRLSLNNGNEQSRLESTYQLYTGDFIKLRNLTVGYTIPKILTQKFSCENARFYVSGENLLTITPFEGIDPEMRAGVGYAMMRQLAFGINVTF